MRRALFSRFGCAALCCVLVVALAANAQTDSIPADSPVADALKRAEAAVQRIVAIADQQRTFDNTLGAVDDLVVQIRLDTEMIQFMAYVSTDAEERDRGRLAEEHVRNWFIELAKREDLYRAVKAYAATNPELKGEQKKLLTEALRDYRRAGMELPPDKRAELKRLELEETRLSLEFDKNIRDDETRVPFTAEELAGLPPEVLERQPQAAGLYLVGLDSPTYMPVQQFCTEETTRKKLYVTYKRKAGRKNVELLKRLLQLRAQRAKLLGYQHFTDYGTETRMAKNAETVMKFYEDLRPLIRRKALLDFEEYKQAKREATGDPNAQVYAWDQFFCHNWLLKNKYAVDAQKVMEYFPKDAVSQGFFAIARQLYGIEFRNVTDKAASKGRPLWHPDVELYEVWDPAAGEMLGELYIDPYPRDNKYNHFASFQIFPRKVWSDGTVQTPLGALVCNFPPPTDDKPSLMPHDDVETFFHEFGHALHGLLTETEYGQFSGTAVARDFVEGPSQLFENWVWDANVLRTFARHYQTSKPLPDELLEAMIEARQLSSGIKAERQVFYGLVDMRYHTVPDGKVDTTATGLATMGQAELFPPVKGTYFEAGFGHMTGYEASYYGYMYARVFAQDMFTYFQQHGLLNRDAGMRYRQKILARGGSMDEMDMLVDFLGREPEMDPFLEFLGLK